MWNVSGYICNHGSLRVGNEILRPLGVAMGNAISVTHVWSIHTKTPPVGRRQPMTSLPVRPQYKGAPGKYVIHFFIWNLRPKHGTAPRGRSVSFPTLREPNREAERGLATWGRCITALGRERRAHRWPSKMRGAMLALPTRSSEGSGMLIGNPLCWGEQC